MFHPIIADVLPCNIVLPCNANLRVHFWSTSALSGVLETLNFLWGQGPLRKFVYPSRCCESLTPGDSRVYRYICAPLLYNVNCHRLETLSNNSIDETNLLIRPTWPTLPDRVTRWRRATILEQRSLNNKQKEKKKKKIILLDNWFSLPRFAI